MIERSALHEIGVEVLAFLLAATCSGCDRPGALLCGPCVAALEPSPVEVTTPSGMPVHVAFRFEGVAARCIRRVKDDGVTRLARPLGRALAAVLDRPGGDALGSTARPVPVPTSRSAFRRRGFRVPEALIRGAGRTPLQALASGGVRLDQRGLDAHGRIANVRGTMRARRAGCGDQVVLVDDVVTTGATLDEACRVLELAGFEVVAAIALAATPRHSPPIGTASATRRR